jgi:zinc protease
MTFFGLPSAARTLPNGLQAIAIKAGENGVVNVQIPVHVGSRNEVEPGKSGFAHFFEHMMFRGTESYPPARYQAIITRAGADQNAYTTDDYTNYHATLTTADLDTLLMLEADRFRHLRLEEQGFRTEALAVKGEYLKNYSDPLEKMEEVLRETAFDTHPYRHTTMGFFADIEAMPDELDYARAFFSRWYRPDNTTVLVTGDIDPDAALYKIERHWRDWTAEQYALEIPAEPAPAGPRFRHIQWRAPTQGWVMVAFRGPRLSVDDASMAAMDFVREVGFSERSDLYQQLVMEDRSVDEMLTDFSDHEDPYLLVIAARLTNDAHAGPVLDAILQAASRAASERVSEARVAAIRDHMRNAFAQALSMPEAIGDALASLMRLDRDPSVIERLLALYDRLTAEDLRDAAARYFLPEGRTVISLSNSADPGIESRALDGATPATRSAQAPHLVELPAHAATASIDVVFKVGAANDPPGQYGLAALTAEMVAEGGTAARPRRAIQNALYPLAADFTARVDKEMTAFAGSAPRERFNDYYAIVRELWLQPGWREEDVQRIKARLIGAIRTDLGADNDEALGTEALYAFVYGADHPYGHYSLGAASALEKLTLDDCRAFYRKHYTPDNALLGVGGGYPPEFGERFRSDVANLSRGSAPRLDLPEPAPIERREALVVSKETPAVAVSFGQPINVVRGDPDWIALWLARAWLGEHRSSVSHLYQRIRELRGMNYGDYAYIEYFPEAMFRVHPPANVARRQQLFEIWLRPLRDNADAVFALRIALFELDRLVTDGMSVEAFEQTREYLHKFVALMVAAPEARLGYAIDSVFYGTSAFVDYVRDGLAELDVEAVNKALARHIDSSRMKFVFVTADADELTARLVNDTPSSMCYNTGQASEVLREDALIGKQPLGFRAPDVRTVEAHNLFE